LAGRRIHRAGLLRLCALATGTGVETFRRGSNWNKQLSEFILMYDDVRTADSPHHALMEFLESTYAGAAARELGPRGVGTTWPAPANT
jgi:hypothetical protein